MQVHTIAQEEVEEQHAGAELAVYALRRHEPVIVDDEVRIGCVIPAYNEEASIARVLEALLRQTRLPDVIHVVVNNSSDDTFFEARKFAGRHEREYRDRHMVTEVFVHDLGTLDDRKVGALNYGFELVRERCDYLLGVDGDTTLDRRAVQQLLDEIVSDTRIGGLSAIYSIDPKDYPGIVPQFLVTGQRQQFADFTMQNLIRGRNMSVLGGQCSIFSIPALNEVIRSYRQSGPWVSDSEVEDSLLSLQIKRVGYSTKISSTARADVGAMDTLQSLDAQQVKWNQGAIDLMWPGQRGNTIGQPFHPNLRLRWAENFSMLMNIVVRLGFALLVFASLSIGAFVFDPLWLIPPAVSILLNLRIALSIKRRTAKDVFFALLFLPGELYMWIRIGHFLRAWTRFFTKLDADNWGAQARAEQGHRSMQYLWPAFVTLVVCAALAFTWTRLPLLVQESILWVAWPTLAILTMLQTLVMLRKLFRRHRGYTV